jgi:hypothetical protein
MTVPGGGGERRGHQTTIHTQRPPCYSSFLKVQVTEFPVFFPCNRMGVMKRVRKRFIYFLIVIFRT